MKLDFLWKISRILTSTLLLLVANGVFLENGSANLLAADCTPAPSGLVGWWPGEGNANDIVGGNNGVLLNGVSFAAGEVGQAFAFTTTNAGVKIPASPALDVGQGDGLTIEGWIYPADLSQRGEIAEWNSGDTNQTVSYGVHLQILAPGELGLGAGNLFADVHGIDGQTHWIMAPGGTLVSNVFQHVALTYDKTTGVATLYRNGSIVAQQNLGIFTPLTSYDFYIGRRPASIGSVHSFSGRIDELSLYNRALSQSEIQAIYNAGSAGKCTPTQLEPAVIAGPITNQANGHIYYLLGNSTWTEAEAKAVTLGGHLATINNKAEDDWVLNTFSTYNGINRDLWIGFYDAAQTNNTVSTNYVWASGQAVTYSNWRPGEPNLPATDYYVYMYGNYYSGLGIAGMWNNVGDVITNDTEPVLNGVVELPLNNSDCTPPPAGLVSWWPGEDNANDIIGTNNGTLQGNLTYTKGLVGMAFSFNATNADVKIPASPTLDVGLSSGFTLESWINVSNTASRTPIFEWNNNAGNWGVHFWVSPSGQGELFANVVDSGGGWHSLSSAAGLVQSGIYEHVALTYDKASGIAKIYLNGNVVAQQSIGSFTPLTSYDLYLGRRVSGAPGDVGTLVGIMDEPSIYNRALSQSEIQAIYNAGSAGKCPLPPTILSVIPPSQYVNEGSTVTYTADAVGSPTLAYQWQYDGSNIVGATSSTLTLSNVVYAQAGTYTITVSNLLGVASTNVTLRVNRAPIADASATDTLLISPNNTNAIAVLDGSRSYDPDGNPLTYAWFHTGDTNPFATTVVAMDTLPVGINQLTLTVNDGMASDSQDFAVEVITTSQAVDRLTALVQTGLTNNTQALVASLEAALASIDRSNPNTAINQLEAFINKVQAQLEPTDPDLASELIADAQAIIDALNGGTALPAAQVEITSISHGQNGRPLLKIKGGNGHIHVIETSTNMVDWVPIGVATQNSDGTYDFDDTQSSQQTGERFYRVVSP